MRNKIILFIIITFVSSLIAIFKCSAIKEKEKVKDDFICNMYSTVLLDTLCKNKPISLETILFFFVDSVGNNMPSVYTNILEESIRKELSDKHFECDGFYENYFENITLQYQINVNKEMEEILNTVDKQFPQFDNNDQIITYDNPICFYVNKFRKEKIFIPSNERLNIQEHISLTILYALIARDISEIYHVKNDITDIIHVKGALMGYKTEYLIYAGNVCEYCLNKKYDEIRNEPSNYFNTKYKIDIYTLCIKIIDYYEEMKSHQNRNQRELDLFFIRSVIFEFRNKFLLNNGLE